MAAKYLNTYRDQRRLHYLQESQTSAEEKSEKINRRGEIPASTIIYYSQVMVQIKILVKIRTLGTLRLPPQ
ncbi:hypothetical protein NPIL_538151 [Nephila pilipes]|uniref:Uncharacterized protein n=1 Tax=Nephila pilipes TaxID=299642 RepID=A0A8X6P7G6_NEPPI|nr:hypothetical protein NPIL_538151 [Nephila pilipes]